MNSTDPVAALAQLAVRYPGPQRPAWNWWVAAVRRHRLALLAPLGCCFLLSLGYALFGPKQWRATQVFHLRDEMIGRNNRPGVFASLDEMKVAQETVLEIARHPDVVRRTLEQLGPSSAWGGSGWPSQKTIEETQGQIQVSAANGAELGKTDLIRLSVVADSPARAKKFAEILRGETEQELRNVRVERARSMQAELNLAVDSAESSLAQVVTEIEQFELNVGPDLAELRNMIEPKTGDILLYRNLGQIQSELRAVQSQLEIAQTQRLLLQQALVADRPDVLATSNDMLNLLPAIRRLKDGWVDAQLKLATVSGEYSRPHPKFLAAEQAVAEVEVALRSELRQAVSSLDDQITLLESNVDRLLSLVQESTARLQRLTEQRVIYDQLNEEYKRRDQVLRELQAELVRTTSMATAAQSVNLLTRVAEVQVASQPEGPSKRLMVGGSTLLGLVIGVGLVMFLAGPLPAGSAPPSESGHSTTRATNPPVAPQAAAAAPLGNAPRQADRCDASPSAPFPNTLPVSGGGRGPLEQSTFVVEIVPPPTDFSSAQY